MSPQRVQRKRTAGWRAPECSCGSGHTAVYVGRAGAGTKFGNPFRPVRLEIGKWPSEDRRYPWACGDENEVVYSGRFATRAEAIRECVNLYASVYLPFDLDITPSQISAELGGHDLMCFCPLDQPCHADVLLHIANQERGTES